MATVAEFTVPSSEFPLGRVFDSLRGATIELERLVPTGHRILPYFWVRNADADAVVRAVANNDALENATVIDDVGDDVLVRTEWAEDADGIVDWLAESDVVLLSAVGTAETWSFEVRVEDADTLSAFQRYCSDHDIPLTVRRLRALADVLTGDEYDLTPEQAEALLLTFDEGYYSEPRETTLEALATQLGITRQSLSSRLRRGYYNLIGSTISDRER